jgi:flagellar biosynthesis/type III secretory pathway protein FliH
MSEKMTVERAKEIIADGQKTSWDYILAKGYLEGIAEERERARKLVEALEDCKVFIKSAIQQMPHANTPWMDGFRRLPSQLKEVVAAYQKAVKP